MRIVTTKLILLVVVLSFIYLLVPFVASAQTTPRHKNGELVNDRGTIYLIKEDKRWGFRTVEEYLSHGYTFDMVLPANAQDLALPLAGILKARAGTFALDTSDGTTLHIIFDDGARPISHPSVVFFLNFDFRPYLPINLSDYPKGAIFGYDGIFLARQPGSLIHNNGTVYLITASGRAPFLPKRFSARTVTSLIWSWKLMSKI